MRIDFKGRAVDEPQVRAGFIGCGSHSFRNLYPTFQFAPVDLVATCDLDIAKARAFAAQFGAGTAYADYREMLEKEDLDAVFVCTGPDKRGRPLYPEIAINCLSAGHHVWIEKPPAASCSEIDAMRQAAEASGNSVGVGLKKMFMPANEKAKALMEAEDFGPPSLLTAQYPLRIPAINDFKEYATGTNDSVRGFLDLCHPVSLMLFLLGPPKTLYYERSHNGAGLATFTYASGSVASLAMTRDAGRNGGMERTTVMGRGHIVVENNIHVSFHGGGPTTHEYGKTPDYFGAPTEAASISWDPEFSLGQLYNKGLFLLGYYNEINQFSRAILEKRAPAKGTLDDAWHVTRVFEAFAEGPGKIIDLERTA